MPKPDKSVEKEGYVIIRTIRDSDGKFIHIGDFIDYLKNPPPPAQAVPLNKGTVDYLVAVLESFNNR